PASARRFLPRSAAPTTASRLSAHQLVEIAPLAARRFFLYQQREPAFVELLEPLVPLNALQRVASAIAGKIETDHANVFTAASPAHAGRARVALFRPTANLFMISQRPAARLRLRRRSARTRVAAAPCGCG